MTTGVAVGLLVVEALGLSVLAWWALRSLPAGSTAFERALRTQRAPAPRLRELERIEHDVVQGAANPLDLHRRLRPLLRQIAAHRLAVRPVSYTHLTLPTTPYV